MVHDVIPAAPSSPMMLPSAIGSAMDIGIKVVGARNQFGLVPKKDSLVNGKENLIADAGLMMGRSFRVGWGPGFVLVHSGTPLGKRETKPAPTTQCSLAGDFLTPKLRPSSSEGSPSFGVTLEKLNVASHSNHGTSDTVLVGSFHSMFFCHSMFFLVFVDYGLLRPPLVWKLDRYHAKPTTLLLVILYRQSLNL